MDVSKKELLKSIFWKMNEISSRTETKTETVIEESNDSHGNIVETETSVTHTYLFITVSHKSADKNNSMWGAVLYGIDIGDGEIVTVALS